MPFAGSQPGRSINTVVPANFICFAFLAAQLVNAPGIHGFDFSDCITDPMVRLCVCFKFYPFSTNFVCMEHPISDLVCASPLQFQCTPPKPANMDLLTSDVLELVFDKLPACDAAVTVGRVCSAWQAAARQRKRHAGPAQQHAENLPLLPMWYLKEAWNSMGDLSGRDRLAKAAMRHGQIDALQHMHDSGWSMRHLHVGRVLSEYGHLAALRWAHELGYIDLADTSMCRLAAGGGHLAGGL